MDFSGEIVFERRYSLEQAMAKLSLTATESVKVSVSVSVSKTAPVVQHIYTQADFERENASFDKLCVRGRQWSSLDWQFSKAVYIKADGGYINKSGKYEKFQHSIYVCCDHVGPRNFLQNKTSIIFTNYAVHVLNAYIRNPMRNLGEKPTDSQISEIYQTGRDRQISYPRNFEDQDRQEIRKRVANIFAQFYQKELLVLVRWLRRTTTQLETSREAAHFLIKNPIGSLADALGCEVWTQFCAGGH